MRVPTNEKIVVTYMLDGVADYVCTRNAIKGKYTLYKVNNGDYQKIKTDNTPIEFDEIVEKNRSK